MNKEIEGNRAINLGAITYQKDQKAKSNKTITEAHMSHNNVSTKKDKDPDHKIRNKE